MSAPADARTLVARLSLPDPAGRAAQEALYAAGDPVVPLLASALGAGEGAAARRAAEVLGWMATPAARAALLAALAAGAVPADLRAAVLRAAIEDAGPADAALLGPALRGLAADRDFFVRAAACDGLARVLDRSADALLESLARDPEGFVRDAALRARAAMGAGAPAAAAAPAERSVPPSSSSPSAAPAGQARAPAPAPSSAAQRFRAARASAEREEALDALVAEGAAAALPALVDACGDPRLAVRLAAARGLARLTDPRALDALFALVAGDTDNDVRGVAASAAAAVAGPADVGAARAADVQRWSQDPDLWVRAAGAALLGLAPVSDTAASRRLVALLGDDAERVAEAAARACLAHARLAHAAHWPEAVRKAIGRLADLRRAPGEADGLVVALLELCAELCGEAEAALAAHAARLFIAWPPDVRAAALALLATVAQPADTELVATLVTMLDDRDERVHAAALRALAASARHAGTTHLGTAGLQRVARLLRAPWPGAAPVAAELLARAGTLGAARALCEAAAAGGVVAEAAAHELGRWPAASDVAVRRGADGVWTAELLLRCVRCRAEMSWSPLSGADGVAREQLRCPSCATLHAVGARDRVVAVTDAPLGVCSCAGCRRPHLLVNDNGQTGENREIGRLRCPVSGEAYLLVSDTRQALPVRGLAFGPCGCCAQAQPLEREEQPGAAPRIVCRRTRTEHALDAAGRYAPARPVALADGAAIDRALLEGSLRVGRSGVAAPTPEIEDL